MKCHLLSFVAFLADEPFPAAVVDMLSFTAICCLILSLLIMGRTLIGLNVELLLGLGLNELPLLLFRKFLSLRGSILRTLGTDWY